MSQMAYSKTFMILQYHTIHIYIMKVHSFLIRVNEMMCFLAKEVDANFMKIYEVQITHCNLAKKNKKQKQNKKKKKKKKTLQK